jgi:DNA-binding response OmpR family regulator
MTERNAPHTVLLYSDDQRVRDRMRLAIGSRPAPDVAVQFVEASTSAEVIRLVNAGEIDLALLDGEATPAGGIGVARQLRDEVAYCPPICLVIARPADRWLAAFAEVEATLMHPLDPMATARTVTELLRDDDAALVEG